MDANQKFMPHNAEYASDTSLKRRKARKSKRGNTGMKLGKYTVPRTISHYHKRKG